MTIEVLLTQAPQRGLKRVGDFRTQAPYVVLYSGGQKMIVQMPITVASRNTILWDQKNFSEGSIAGAATLDVYNTNKSAGGSMTDAIKSGATSGDTAAKAWDAVKDIGTSKGVSAAGGVLGVNDAADYMRMQQGKAINPNKELMFQGMGFRVFTFEWEFVPTNEEQADQINDFIYTIQLMSACGFAEGSTYLSYPELWQVLIYPQKYMPLIMPCYVTDYNINYGAVGRMVFHEGGAPVQVNVSVSFTEAQMHTRDQIEKGFWG